MPGGKDMCTALTIIRFLPCEPIKRHFENGKLDPNTIAIFAGALRVLYTVYF